MWLCPLCDKPFSKESSHRRHISYCRRNENRPRLRPKSCRQCNAAKVKCTFQHPCRRCTARGLDCAYELSRRLVSTAANEQANVGIFGLYTDDHFPVLNAYPLETSASSAVNAIEDTLRITDVFELPNASDETENIFTELLPPNTQDRTIPNGYDGTSEIATVSTIPMNNALVFENWSWPLSSIQPHMGQAAQSPWSLWTTSPTNQPTPNLNDIIGLPKMGCLALLQSSNRVVQHNLKILMQALRAYPLMMARRETLPPFIYPFWNRHTIPALPEPLSNCMSIAQMYAFRTEETKPFLWKMIKTENERFLTQRLSYSAPDLLAAIQAQIIYTIMRFVDGSVEPPDMNQQLVLTYQFLCKQFRKLCDATFCEVDHYFPRPSWEDWIFAESRRRTACLFFLICGCVSFDAGLPECDAFEGFRQLPLSCPKTIWEAKTRADWETEYSTYGNMRETGIPTMGMLVEAHKRKEDPANSSLLDYWASRADNLGSLLNLVASMA